MKIKLKLERVHFHRCWIFERVLGCKILARTHKRYEDMTSILQHFFSKVWYQKFHVSEMYGVILFI